MTFTIYMNNEYLAEGETLSKAVAKVGARTKKEGLWEVWVGGQNCPYFIHNCFTGESLQEVVENVRKLLYIK